MIISSIVLIQLLAYGVPLVQAGSYMETYQKYKGHNKAYSLFCTMTVKELTKERLVADIKMENTFYHYICYGCEFYYMISISGTTNRSTALRESYKLQTSSWGIADNDCQSRQCLDDLARELHMGLHCRYNAYPQNGHMIFEACRQRFDLSPES
ncbi:hypothetical protein Pmar_PMAR024958 [Perkinsus marinus ATCC 50983]|uniref:Uncharacterized protein n=1 Tax=Perkinsus marinus (strain ATCC 50983 / TXsc) TaxID=423536 RepID=C5L9Q1_PERM5|nr:hypothetical protein Pmar_PMAR024958 [Perkinsus marinus ATCC 50983]EER06541.1 hypothetical protein Pmar_PMAR024958 [Perkinsus marinus ATCC 50983]|eukprot:XP_002774725.1 hypothetical protein Pmar_PMAR024958 [Perkinsus marinus ATCC 50983]